jgi:chromosome segregation ATPase
MFSFKNIQIKIIIGLFLIGVITSGFFYIKHLNSQLEIAELQRKQLTEIIQNQELAMNSLRDDINRMNRVQREYSDRMNDIERSASSLARRFRETANGQPRNFQDTAAQRPESVQQAINRGTREALRCNEIVTGSPLTEDERNGRVTNTICPELMGTR